MNLSKEASEEVDKLRRLKSGEIPDGIWGKYHESGLLCCLENIADEMLRLFPVRMLNGLVIRWDDPVTPERLIASGFAISDFCLASCGIVFYPLEGRWWSNGLIVPKTMEPDNMGEVWRLMEKCGCTVKGDGE